MMTLERAVSMSVKVLEASANGTAIDTYRQSRPAYEYAIACADVANISGLTGTATAATLSTNLTGDNNDLTFTAKAAGIVGNAISVTYVNPEEDGAISVSVTGTDITVTLAFVTDAITTTAANIKTAIEANAAANALVTVANKAANNGTGVVTAMTKASLTGGVENNATISWQESDASNFGSGVSTVKGGDAVVAEDDHSFYWNLHRTKRYLRAVVTISGGSTPDIEVHASVLLTNTPVPYGQFLTPAKISNI